MKNKKTRALLSLLTAAALVFCSSCSLFSDSKKRENESEINAETPDTVTSSKSASGIKPSGAVSLDVISSEDADSDSSKSLLYVTGVNSSISLKKSDEDNSEVLAKLAIGDEVEFISYDYPNYYYVYSESNNVSGYIKKEYLTDEKSAVCKRQDAYISKQTSLYDTKDSSHTHIQNLSRNSGIFIVAKYSGDFWYVYDKTSKIFGYVGILDISLSKVEDTSSASATSSAIQTPSSAPNLGFYIGSGNAPSNYTKYYAMNTTNYLAIRSDKSYDSSNIMGEIYNGEAVYVLDKNSDSVYWYCYSPTNHVYGYVNSNFLAETASVTDLYGLSTYYVWYVSGDGDLNERGSLALRYKPADETSNVMDRLSAGEEVYVFDNSYENYNDTYWYVYVPSLSNWGYAASEFLSTNDETDSGVYICYPPHMDLNSDGYAIRQIYGNSSEYVELRKAPSSEDKNVIGKLENGDKIYLTSNCYSNYTDEFWYVYVPTLNRYGYVNRKCIVGGFN